MEKIQVERRGVMTGHRDCVYALERSPVDSVFYSAGGDGMIVEWDLNRMEEGRLVARVPNSVYGLHYLEGVDLLVAGHNYEGVHFIDVHRGKEVANLQCTQGAIFTIEAWDNRLFVGDSSGTLTVIDLKHLKVVDTQKLAVKSLRTIAFNADHTEIALGYSDHVLRILDINSLELLAELKDHNNSVFSAVYSPDGRDLLSAGRDAHLHVREATGDYAMRKDIVAHMYAINNVAFSPDGKHFVTCSMDKSIKIWDAKTYRLLKVIDKARHAGHGTSVNKLLWTTFDNILLSASDDRTISAWKLELN